MTAPMTRRERDVWRGVASGKLNKTIAHDLGISVATVKVYLTRLMRKLGVTNRVQVALRFHRIEF